MPVWGDHRITWRQILPPAAVVLALVSVGLALTLWIRGPRVAVDREEQYQFYVQQLANPDPAMVANAVERLGDFDKPELAEKLRPMLDAADPRVVGAACGALGKLGDTSATEKILAGLRSRDPSLARGAAVGAGGLKLGQAVDPLVSLLAGPSLRIRLAAVEALGAIGDRKALAALERLEANAAAGLQPEPADDERQALADALAKALAALRGAQ